MSSLDDLECPWGQLVNLEESGDEDAEIFPIVGDNFTIGRGKGKRKFLSAKFNLTVCEIGLSSEASICANSFLSQLPI